MNFNQVIYVTSCVLRWLYSAWYCTYTSFPKSK